MANGRVLITVKTYPTLSRKYGETVCTAGVCEDGSWVRIYPVPFRRLDETEQYAKYDWIDCKLIKSKSDPRPETRHPTNLSDLKPVEHMGTEDNWRDRRKLLLRMAAGSHPAAAADCRGQGQYSVTGRVQADQSYSLSC